MPTPPDIFPSYRETPGANYVGCKNCGDGATDYIIYSNSQVNSWIMTYKCNEVLMTDNCK